MRHAVLALLVALGLPALPASAQPGKPYRIAMVETTSQSANRANYEAFLKGLREAGYVEGKNVIIDYRSVEGRSERYAPLAATLAREKPDVIVTRGFAAARALRNAGIPVVMATSFDPIAAGLAKSLARPGGNVTGLTTLGSGQTTQRVQVLKELTPHATRIAALINLADPTADAERRETLRACESLGVEPIILDVRDVEGLERALERAVQRRADALVVNGDALLIANRELILDFARQKRLPVMYAAREYVEGGGLIAYGVSYPDLYYRAASYVDKILKGANPGELPIQRPSKMSLVINVSAATALGIAIPSQLLLRADELIR